MLPVPQPNSSSLFLLIHLHISHHSLLSQPFTSKEKDTGACSQFQFHSSTLIWLLLKMASLLPPQGSHNSISSPSNVYFLRSIPIFFPSLHLGMCSNVSPRQNVPEYPVQSNILKHPLAFKPASFFFRVHSIIYYLVPSYHYIMYHISVFITPSNSETWWQLFPISPTTIKCLTYTRHLVNIYWMKWIWFIWILFCYDLWQQSSIVSLQRELKCCLRPSLNYHMQK